MRTMLAIVVFVFIPQFLSAQPQALPADSLFEYFQFDDSAPFSFLETYFPPFLIEDGIELKSFIRSRTFRKIREQFSDLKAVDAVYIRAMKLTKCNTAMALMIASLATFDHRLVGLKIPVFKLFLPLSNESDKEFARRVSNLPTRLYADSPTNFYGDRDKLQHFFGSAFLTFVFESRDASERFGTFIEKGEDAFIVDGMNDERDARANHQGQQFGLALLNDNHRLPSEFIKFEIAKDSPDQLTHVQLDVPICKGAW